MLLARAVLGTLCIVTVTPTLSLPFDGHGLQSFGSQSDLGLSECLSRLRHVERAAEVAAWGEILTFPVVLVLIFLYSHNLD